MTIALIVNGKDRTLTGETALPTYLESIGVDPKLVAVAVNGEVVPRDERPNVVLRDGDSIEIVRMVGGG